MVCGLGFVVQHSSLLFLPSVMRYVDPMLKIAFNLSRVTVWGLGSGVLGLKIGVWGWGFGFWVWTLGFGFGVMGFGFWGLCFGFRF